MYCKNVSIEAYILYMSPEFYILEKGTLMFRVIMKGGGGLKGTDVKKKTFYLCIWSTGVQTEKHKFYAF